MKQYQGLIWLQGSSELLDELCDDPRLGMLFVTRPTPELLGLHPKDQDKLLNMLQKRGQTPTKES